MTIPNGWIAQHWTATLTSGSQSAELLGLVTSLTLPKIERESLAMKQAGMAGEYHVPGGFKAMECEMSLNVISEALFLTTIEAVNAPISAVILAKCFRDTDASVFQDLSFELTGILLEFGSGLDLKAQEPGELSLKIGVNTFKRTFGTQVHIVNPRTWDWTTGTAGSQTNKWANIKSGLGV